MSLVRWVSVALMSPTHRSAGSPRVRRRVALSLAVVILAALLGGVLVLAMGDRGPGSGEQDAAEAEAAEPGPIAVVGDSNTEMGSSDFAAGRIGEDSWVSTVMAAGHPFAGGWAVSGSTSVDQAAGLEEVEGADVLLIMTGTNDLAQGVSFDETAASLETIVEKAPAERVVILAIPPRDQETMPTSTDFNRSLMDLTAARGWEFFDGLEFLRSPDGGFVVRTSEDGVHLTPDAQEQFGETVVDYLADDADAPANG